MSLSRYEIANYGIDKGKEKERGKNTSRKINNDNNNNKKAEKE